MNNSIKLGLILTAVGVISLLLFRFVLGAELLFSGKQIFASFSIMAIILIVGGRKLLRDPEVGRLSYGAAVKGLFIALMVSSILTLVFGVLLLGNDQALKEAYEEYQIKSQDNALDWGMKLAGASDAEREDMIAQNAEKRAKGEVMMPSYPYSWSMIPMNLAMSALMHLFFSLLLALFVKEKDSEYT